MSGQLCLSRPSSDPIDRRRDHAKYAVKVATHRDRDGGADWIATAGWDAKVLLYRPNILGQHSPRLGDPVAQISLTSNPEALAFVDHPESGQPILILTRRDSSFLYYYTLGSEPILLGKQNLAPHSNAWVAFTPSAIALSPIDAGLLAVATSAVSHMKLIIVKLLLPPADVAARQQEVHASAAAQARADVVLRDREAAAIQLQCSTFATQTQYSTPSLAWRPDGSGVWVNSDDGVIRGIEARTGKVMASLVGHDAATKIRCLASAIIKTGDDKGPSQEWLVSGGFDQKLIVWKSKIQ